MIKKARKAGIGEKPLSCAKCQYYQPDFKYRKCLYSRCPYQRDTDIFRKRPLKKDKIPKEVVILAGRDRKQNRELDDHDDKTDCQGTDLRLSQV